MTNIETQANTVIGYIDGRRVIQLSLRNGKITTDTSTALPTNEAGEYIDLYSDCLSLLKQRQQNQAQQLAQNVSVATSPSPHDDLLFARYQGFHDYLTEGEGSGRTHPSSQDWNEAYDEGRNEAEGLNGPEGSKPFSMPEVGASFDEGRYLDLCKMIDEAGCVLYAHPDLSPDVKESIAKMILSQFGLMILRADAIAKSGKPPVKLADTLTSSPP
ncbi:hypothetical protein ACTXK7_07355 [Vreelandella alkaliphila]|uniref:hypothetical protein n=1 Tax=Vreelandella alkaliphila TaxID=272774 RepID=UPI003FD8FA1C